MTSRVAEHVIVCGGFDDMRLPGVRLLEEAARLGPLHVLLWSDAFIRSVTGRDPKFPQAERQYFVEAIRHVDGIHLIDEPADPSRLPSVPGLYPRAWVVPETEDQPAKRDFCTRRGLEYAALAGDELVRIPEEAPPAAKPSGRKKVLVTGCYDWFHTGHIRFFEECAELGALYVVVGHDANIRLLKGDAHPMFDERYRRYMVQSIRHVTQALISTGDGWMDAAPEIAAIEPDIYAVNEDGDKPVKRQFCAEHGIEYVVLKRLPHPGLPQRESTHLRGF